MEANLADGWLRVWLDDEKVPYAFHKPSKQWIGYDDIDSIKIKAQYIKDQGLGGAMVWALDLDDFAALEHKDAPYPLGRALRDVLTDNQQFPEFKAPPVPEKKDYYIYAISTDSTCYGWHHS
nr:hypothetical protein BaRGS_026634 [Batillaria attramentaria]